LGDRNGAKMVRVLATRAYTEYWQGAGVDQTKLAQALPPLPDTANELKAIARSLGAPANDIHLGKEASETTVKNTLLADYRVVYFATHGLVAGEIKGLAEPALALTIPPQPTRLSGSDCSSPPRPSAPCQRGMPTAPSDIYTTSCLRVLRPLKASPACYS
jgi:hypothetical protein